MLREFGFLAGALLFLLDFQNILSWWGRRTLKPATRPGEDFTILVPLFGHPRYFRARECLEPIRDRVMVVCEVTPQVMANYADELEAAGFGTVRVRLSDPNPAALVKIGLDALSTTYALRLDADTIVNHQIAAAVAAVAAAGADLASVRVEVREPTSLCTHLQAVEYRIAMLARRYRPWLTSGACFIGRTDALRRIFALHSLRTPGEDIETGRVALALGMRIRTVDYVAYTEAPETFKSLFHQRLLWWAGNFRHMVINFDRNLLQLPVQTLYYMLGAWVAIYFHVWTAVSWHSVAYLPWMLLVYLGITAVTNVQVLSPWMLIFPVYAMLQTLVMPPLGAVKYTVMAWQCRDIGRYRFGWRPRYRH